MTCLKVRDADISFETYLSRSILTKFIDTTGDKEPNYSKFEESDLEQDEISKSMGKADKSAPTLFEDL